MTDDERIIGECLRAAVEGPFFPDWEFSLLFGLERHEVAAVLASWPRTDDPEVRDLAVNNALNNLLGYPHKKMSVWSDYISVSPAEVAAVFRRWRGEGPGGGTYFERMK
jgi:hypothetical protein